jgi:uncharacterized ferredoxin-like protein
MNTEDIIAQGIDTVTQLMAIAAITAPKAKGESCVAVEVLKGPVLQDLSRAMDSFGERTHKVNFDRDGKNVAKSDAVLLIGLKEPNTVGLNCGACGYATCAELLLQKPVEGEFRGPICAHRLLDMGIALGSAVKTASLLNVDNRIMYRIGAVAREMGLVDWQFVLGIPVSVTGKSIYFDR